MIFFCYFIQEEDASKSSVHEVSSSSAVPIAGIPLPPVPPARLDVQSIPLPPMPPSHALGVPPPVARPSSVPPLPLSTTGIEGGILPPPSNPPPKHMYSKKNESDISELKEKTSATSVIAAKSTVVPLPKAHLDTNGAYMSLFFFS